MWLIRYVFLCLVLSLTCRLAAQTNIVVAADGSGQFKSVQAAIMSVPSGSATNPVIIHIKPGIYKELIYVQREKCFFRLIGDDPDKNGAHVQFICGHARTGWQTHRHFSHAINDD